MGEECESNSRYASTDGYKCIAGKSEPDHPDYTNEGSEVQLQEHMALDQRHTEILRSLMDLS